MIEFVAPANTPVIDRGVITEPTGVEEPAEDGDVEAKARHVRDAAFWGAPVGTPLPLPKKPDTPDADLPHLAVLPKVVAPRKETSREVLHRYQKPDIERQIARVADRMAEDQWRLDTYREHLDSLAGLGEGYEQTYFRYQGVAAETVEALKQDREITARLQAVLDGEAPYPEPTVAQVDDYISTAMIDASKRLAAQWREAQAAAARDGGEQTPLSDLIEKDSDVVALRRAKQWAEVHRRSEYGIGYDDNVLDYFMDYKERLLSGLDLDGYDPQDFSDKELASAMKQQSQRELYLRIHQMDPGGAKRKALIAEVLPDATDKTQDALELAAIRAAISNWAASSGDDRPECAAMQHIAQKVFDLDPEHSYLPDTNHPEALAANLARGTEGREMLLTAMYEQTQQWLKDEKIDAVLVYRGLRSAHWREPGYTDVVQQPMSSWSVAPFIGDEFGYVMATIVPREQILATPRTGFGCLQECEVVTIADVLRVEVGDD